MTTTAEDALLIAWRQARADAKRFYDNAMADADRIYDQWLVQQRAAATRTATLSTATWQDRLAALQALAEAVLRMRKPGDWYVSQQVEIGGDRMLTGSYGNGKTPQEAVENHWHIYTTLPENRYIVLRHDGKQSRHARWDGDAWQTWPAP